MKYFNIIFFSILLVFVSTNCKGEYKRQEGCHLDKLGISGNVVKVETIVQSSMPLTELFANKMNHKRALSTIGNFSIDFNNKGNVKHFTGYGIDGKLLFDESWFTVGNETNIVFGIPLDPGGKQDIDGMKTVSTINGNIVNVKYYDNNELIWDQRIAYDNDGLIDSIIMKYESLSIDMDYFTITPADTTTFHYLSYDKMHNWTEAKVVYKGILPKHAHTYKIKRQLTYYNEEERPALIDFLDEYNHVKPQYTAETDNIRLGKYGNIDMPHYMTMRSNKETGDFQKSLSDEYGTQINYLFMSVYDSDDAYASISVNLIDSNGAEGLDNLSPEELIYDKEIDEYFEALYTMMLAQGNTYILKWLPYEFVNISGKRALRIRYYRYGKGSPIPVYCEKNTIQMDDGNKIDIIYSFQSNLDYRFRNDFDRAIKSIKFN